MNVWIEWRNLNAVKTVLDLSRSLVTRDLVTSLTNDRPACLMSGEWEAVRYSLLPFLAAVSAFLLFQRDQDVKRGLSVRSFPPWGVPMFSVSKSGSLTIPEEYVCQRGERVVTGESFSSRFLHPPSAGDSRDAGDGIFWLVTRMAGHIFPSETVPMAHVSYRAVPVKR